MIEVKWKVSVPKKALTDPQLSGQPLETACFAAVRTLSLLADAEVTQRTPVDRGQLRGAWQPTAVKLGQSYRAMVVNPVTYAIPVNDGQKPHWPPSAPLKGWAQRVLGDARLWFVVARKISKEGTKPVHMVEQALEVLKGKAPTILAEAIARVKSQF